MTKNCYKWEAMVDLKFSLNQKIENELLFNV